MLHCLIMQTAVLDSYAILPLVASLLTQGVAGYFLFKIWKTKPEKFPDPTFFKLATVFVGILGLGCILAIIIPSLLVFSSGVLIASIILVVFLVLYLSFVPTAIEAKTEECVPAAEGPAEDPLVEIGQEFISHVSGSLTQEVNLTRLLDFINETMIKHTASDGGVVFLADDFEDIITSKAFSGKFPPPYKLPQDIPHKSVRVETNFRYAQFKLGETIFGEVAATGKPVLIERGEEDARIFANGPEDFLKPGSYIVVPLMIRDRVVGISGIARLPENKPFGSEEFRIAKTLASYAGASINNVYSVQEILERADLEREAGIASQIQKTLHPKRLPRTSRGRVRSFLQRNEGCVRRLLRCNPRTARPHRDPDRRRRGKGHSVEHGHDHAPLDSPSRHQHDQIRRHRSRLGSTRALPARSIWITTQPLPSSAIAPLTIRSNTRAPGISRCFYGTTIQKRLKLSAKKQIRSASSEAPFIRI